MTAALEPCPNPECGGGKVKPAWYEDSGVYVARFFCGVCKTSAAEAKGADLEAVIREARRLWFLLPRAPRWTSEPPPDAGYYWNKVGDAEPYITEFLPRDVGLPNIPGILIAGPIPQPAERSDRDA